MKRTLFALLLLLPGLSLAAPKLGFPAPDFAVVDTTGKVRTLSEFAGHIVVLEWSNPDCTFVDKHYHSNNMQDMQKRYAKQGVVWLTVYSAAPGTDSHVTPSKAEAVSKQRNAAPTAILLDEDGKLGRSYGARVAPHLYVFDKQGRLAYMGGIDSIYSPHTIDIDKAIPFTTNAVDALLNGREVAQPLTRIYGCPIEY